MSGLSDPNPESERSAAGRAAGLAAFFRLVGELKRIRRQGWVDRGVRDVESVADHTYRMAS